MMNDSSCARPYRSTSRAAAAGATREAVLAAAQCLFQDRGFALTTMDQIAARAGVSRPTVFAMGSKPALLAQLRDRALAAQDEGGPVRGRAWFIPLAELKDSPEVLSRYAERVSQRAARCAQVEEALHHAAASHEELREVWRMSERQRYDEVAAVVDLIAAGCRRDRDTSCDLLWSLTASQLYHRLVHLRRWSHERYVQWLPEMLCEQLLTVARPPVEAQPRRRFRRGTA